MATVKVKGQGHLKTKVKVTYKLRKYHFCSIFVVKFFTHGAYSGSCHSPKVKGQGHLKVKFDAIVPYH